MEGASIIDMAFNERDMVSNERDMAPNVCDIVPNERDMPPNERDAGQIERDGHPPGGDTYANRKHRGRHSHNDGVHRPLEPGQ
jgi:hypothetical protein